MLNRFLVEQVFSHTTLPSLQSNLQLTNSNTIKLKNYWDFPGGAVVKNLSANAGDTGLGPGPEDPTCCEATKPVHHNY